ncbi:MAG TPA: WecB/TagA/CpsF family glycosyltransferase [Candidatus Doudnabacteria bacterium]|nr:WecB/TagA/CpsF family glycosyltransferase [Candidatus Doudnabacteria bacterium]
MYKPITIGPIKISAITKAEFLAEVKRRVSSGEQTFVTTPYSEFLYAALRSGEVRDLLAKADLAIADGIGVLWAERFLSEPLRANSHFGKIFEAWTQVVTSGARILLAPKFLYKNIPEKIVGAEVFFDLCRLAEQENFSVFLLNDWSDSAQKTAELLKQKYPQLKIAGVSNKTIDDQSVKVDIAEASPDLLFVGYGNIKQERWIAEHLKDLPVKMAMGVGGTFDYAAGNKLRPPKFIRRIGLEWLFRLFTQPRRVPRIYRATIGLMISLVRYKVFKSYPFRSNAVAVVVNNENKILLCKRIVAPSKNGQSRVFLDNYWQFPQGGIDNGENLLNAAARELEEETGIKSVEPLLTSSFLNQYEWLHGNRPVVFNQRPYNGQAQQTVLFRFFGDESEIKVDGREFEQYEWLSVKEVLQRIAPERRNHAENVLNELSDYLEKSA